MSKLILLFFTILLLGCAKPRPGMKYHSTRGLTFYFYEDSTGIAEDSLEGDSIVKWWIKDEGRLYVVMEAGGYYDTLQYEITIVSDNLIVIDNEFYREDSRK